MISTRPINNTQKQRDCQSKGGRGLLKHVRASETRRACLKSEPRNDDMFLLSRHSSSSRVSSDCWSKTVPECWTTLRAKNDATLQSLHVTLCVLIVHMAKNFVLHGALTN